MKISYIQQQQSQRVDQREREVLQSKPEII